MIDRAALTERMAALESDRNQAIANIQAITGAIQDCAYWLAQLDNEETQTDEGDEQGDVAGNP